jgi:hypothetical protein
MIESVEDLWKFFMRPGCQVAISTNGCLTKKGEAVMGRGCALQATYVINGVRRLLGNYLKRSGNVPGYLIIPEMNDMFKPHPEACLMILPVKHNWWEKADMKLVRTSAEFLNAESIKHPDWEFHVPRIGCSNGKLSWNYQVKPIMSKLLNNVIVHHLERR